MKLTNEIGPERKSRDDDAIFIHAAHELCSRCLLDFHLSLLVFNLQYLLGLIRGQIILIHIADEFYQKSTIAMGNLLKLKTYF
jgi:hypothetical protein